MTQIVTMEEYGALKMNIVQMMDQIGSVTVYLASKGFEMGNVLILDLAIRMIQCHVMLEKNRSVYLMDLCSHANVRKTRNVTQ